MKYKKIPILIILFSLMLSADNIPLKVIAIYNNQLALRVDVDGLDMKLCLKDIKPLKDKMPIIIWYINKEIKTKKQFYSSLPIKKDGCLYSHIYLEDKKLRDILKQKKLIH